MGTTYIRPHLRDDGSRDFKTAMSCSKEPANDDRPFEFKNLPAELVENIYLYSGNLQLPLVNRSFYYLLSHDTTRLRLCSYIFNHSFTSKYEYTNPNFSADNEDDMEVVKLQTNLLNQVWLSGPFALRLEALTPELQARAIYRRGEDGQLRQGLPPLQWRGTGPRVTEGNVHMPKTWLIGSWTEDRAEMFHRLRGWYIDPQAFSEPQRTRLDQAGE